MVTGALDIGSRGDRYRSTRCKEACVGRLSLGKLQQAEFFHGHSSEFISTVADFLQLETFLVGSNVMTEGDVGNRLFYLYRGEADVLVGQGKIKVATLGPGAVFGEMALLSSSLAKRTATIRATEFCDCRVLDNHTFHRLLRKFPDERGAFERMAKERLQELERAKRKDDDISEEFVEQPNVMRGVSKEDPRHLLSLPPHQGARIRSSSGRRRSPRSNSRSQPDPSDANSGGDARSSCIGAKSPRHGTAAANLSFCCADTEDQRSNSREKTSARQSGQVTAKTTPKIQAATEAKAELTGSKEDKDLSRRSSLPPISTSRGDNSHDPIEFKSSTGYEIQVSGGLGNSSPLDLSEDSLRGTSALATGADLRAQSAKSAYSMDARDEVFTKMNKEQEHNLEVLPPIVATTKADTNAGKLGHLRDSCRNTEQWEKRPRRRCYKPCSVQPDSGALVPVPPTNSKADRVRALASSQVGDTVPFDECVQVSTRDRKLMLYNCHPYSASPRDQIMWFSTHGI